MVDSAARRGSLIALVAALAVIGGRGEGGIEPKAMNIINKTTDHPESNACRQ